MILFTSQIISSKGVERKIELHSKTDFGLRADIIGGTGNTYYIANDWTDFTDVGEDIDLETTLSSVFTDTIVSITYNEANNRTEIEVSAKAYTSETWKELYTKTYYPSAFEPIIIDIKTEYKNGNDNILDTFKSSYTDVTYANNDAWFDRFYESFIESDDEEYRLVIYKDSSGWELEWCGNVLADLTEWGNTSKPRPYTLRVTDGIDKLKGIEFDDILSGAYTDAKLIDHVINILEKNDLSQFWGTNDDYIRESLEWHETQVTGANSGYSPMDYTRMDKRLFIDKSDTSTPVALSCYDALKAILQLFRARMFIADGVYHIQQFRNYDNAANYAYRAYKKSGATPTLGAFSFKKNVVSIESASRSTELIALGQGKFGYLAGARRTTTKAKTHTQAKQENSTNFYVTNANSPKTLIYGLGTVRGGSGSGAVMRVEIDVMDTNPNGLTHPLDVTCTIDAGSSYWLKSPVNLNYTHWVTYSSAVSRRINAQGFGRKTTLSFDSPEIPFTEETVSCLFSFSTAGEWYVYQIRIYFPVDGVDGATQEVYVENPNTKYTKYVELESLLVTDMSNTTSINTLEVDENYVSGSPSWVESEVWDGGFDTNEPLTWLGVMEAMSLQYKPINRYMGGIEGNYNPLYALVYNGNVFVFHTLEYDYQMDEWSGEWIQCVLSTTGISITTNDETGEVGTEGQGGETAAFQANQMESTFQVAELSGDATGTVTSLTITATGHSRIKEGDTISLIDPVTLAEAGSFTVTADVDPTNTSISVSSETLTDDLKAGMIIMHKKGEVLETNLIRLDTMQYKGDSAAPSSSIDTVGESKEVRIVDGNIYLKNNAGGWVKLTGMIF